MGTELRNTGQLINKTLTYINVVLFGGALLGGKLPIYKENGANSITPKIPLIANIFLLVFILIEIVAAFHR